MFNYEKRLEYPVHITRTDPKAAMVIISQYGGPYSASLGEILLCFIIIQNLFIVSHSLWLCHKLLIHISHFIFVSHFRVPGFRIQDFNGSSLRDPAVCSCLFRGCLPQ